MAFNLKEIVGGTVPGKAQLQSTVASWSLAVQKNHSVNTVQSIAKGESFCLARDC